MYLLCVALFLILPYNIDCTIDYHNLMSFLANRRRVLSRLFVSQERAPAFRMNVPAAEFMAIKELAQWHYSIEFHNLTCRWFASRYAQLPVVRCTAMHMIYFTERKCSTTRDTLSARSIRGVALVRRYAVLFPLLHLYTAIFFPRMFPLLPTPGLTTHILELYLTKGSRVATHTPVTLEKTNFPMSLTRSQ